MPSGAVDASAAGGGWCWGGGGGGRGAADPSVLGGQVFVVHTTR